MNFDTIKLTEDEFQLTTYKKMSIAVERGLGSWIWTSEGDKYLDLYGGHAVCGTGHSHPHVVNAIKTRPKRSCSIRILFIRTFAAAQPRNSYRSLRRD